LILFLFRRYGIESALAVVYVKRVKTELSYSEELLETKIENFYVSYGDVNLFYHLYVIDQASGNKVLVILLGNFFLDNELSNRR